MDLEGKQSLLEWLGGVEEECSKFHMDQFTYKVDLNHEMDVNWKTYIDNYQVYICITIWISFIVSLESFQSVIYSILLYLSLANNY